MISLGINVYFFRSLKTRFLTFSFNQFDPNLNYIYYPLHVDPKLSTMVLSPYHTNQLAIIESLAKNIPPHFYLVVKEHFPMIGFRPKDFTKKYNPFLK